MIVSEALGDLFACDSQTITCPINAVGAMGRGLALEFRQRVPGLYDYYQKHYPRSYSRTTSRANELQVFKVPDGRQVLLFPTKDHWKNPSTVMLVQQNLETLAELYERRFGITSLAIPALGCGLGGLSYDRDVRPLIHSILGPLPIPVSVLFSYESRVRF